MANQVNKDAIVRFLTGYEDNLSKVDIENGTVYFALKPDPLNPFTKTIGSIYLDANNQRIMMSGESLATLDEVRDRILTKYIKGIDFDANSNAEATNNGAKGILTYVKGNGDDVNVDVPSASASAAGFVTTGAQTFAGAKTFKSPIITTGGSYVHSAAGTSGTPGYVKIATFKINGTYQNTPIVIELVDRVRKGSCVLNIQFKNENSNDPTLATFTFEGVDYNCYLYKSATSTWDLYVKKGEDHGQPTVVRFHKSPHMSKVAVTWTNAHADTIPSEAQSAVLGGNVANASNADFATKSTGDGQGNNIYTTYLSDLTSTNNASIFTIQGIKKNGGNSPTTITINGATTEKAGLMTAEEQSFAGEKKFTDTTTFSGTSGFEYSGIESATSNSARVVWFAHANKKGTPVYHNDFTYNPGTKTLTVGKISGTITKATGDGQGNEIYSTYLSDVASSNDGTTFNIWGLTKKGGDSPTIVTIEGATTKKAGLVTTGEQTWAGEKTFNNDITISGAKTNIQKEGSSTSWIDGRDTALIKLTSYKGYNAITSMKTTNGDWSYGVYTDDIAYWTYTPDAQYTAKDNKNYVQMKLTPAGKLITVNSETGHLFAKSVAIGSDNTNYKLYNIGTTYLADALTVDARATVDTLKISKTEMAKHIEFAREGFNYIATAANGCIAFLPNGASPEKDTSRLIVEDGGARPGATNTYNLGTPGNRWKNIYGNALNISGASTLTGAVTLGGNLSVGGTLGVTGATTLSSTLTVTGKTVLSSVVEIGNDLTVTGAIFGKDKLTIGQADLNTNYTVYVNGSSYFKGNVTSNGTLHLTKTTDGAATADNNVALIIGPRDSTHLIADNNEIMAKSNGTAAGPLYLNNDGGQVVVGAGGFTTSGYIDAAGGNGFRIRRSDVTYGRFCAITAGTTSAAGVGQLILGNATSTGTANNAVGVLRLYGLGDKYTDIRTVQGSGNYAYYFSNHGQTGYSIARGAVRAYGGLTTPVWIDANGNVVAFVDTIGSTAIPVYMKDGAITEITPADMFSVLKWNAGTTAGPTLDMTIGTYRRTAVIPSATKDNSGVVTTTTQAFSGDKTFANAVNVTGKATFDSLVKLKNELSVAGGLIAKDSLTVGQETLNTTYKFYVKGNSGFSGDATLSGTLHLTNTTNSAASSDPNVALVIGNRAAQHLLIDDRGIQSKKNGTAADTLSLNPNGGTTLAGGNIQTASTFRATGLDKGYQLYRNSVSYGHFYVDTDGAACTTDGTTGTAGVAILTLGNSTAQSSTLNSGANNAYGVVRLYSVNTGYGDIRYVYTADKRTYYISNHGATAYSLGRDSSSKAYGSTVKPVWFNSSGMVTAFVDTVGSTAIPVYMNEGAITQVKPADMFSELKWVAGTSAGPVINMTIGTQNRTAKIPIATQTNSGVVIAGAQTFGGAKTFTGTVTVNDMMKVGRYIDFRCSTNTTTNDYYSVRFDAGTGDKGNVLYLPDITGQLVVHTNNIQIGSGTKPVYVAESGAVTASIATVGGSTTPMYLLDGIMTSCDYGVGALHATKISPTTKQVYLLGTSSSSTGYRTTTYFNPEVYITTLDGQLSCASVESRGSLYGGNSINLRHGIFGMYARLFISAMGTECTTDGTAGATGVTYMHLGNNIAVSTAAGHGGGNSCGVLRIYGSNKGFIDIRCGTNGTIGHTLYLPGASGQIVYHTDDTQIGETDTPVYVSSEGKVLACSTKLTDYVLKAGDTMTGNLAIEKASGNAGFTATRTDTGISVSFGVGSRGTERGVYDNNLHQWIIYSDGTGDAKTGLNLAIKKAIGTASFTTERTDTKVSVLFGVGSDGTNRGVYDNNLSKWIIYSDGTDAAKTELNLAIENASDTTSLTTTQTDTGTSVSFGVGSNGTYRGVYDNNLSKWIIYSDGTGDAKTGLKLCGAVWNDYAEFRQTKDKVEPGRVVIETGRGDLKLSTERLQPGANVVSDTFGFAIGETKKAKTPLAVAGRVLVYTFEDKYSYKPGDAVCTGPNGTVSKMTREEIWKYPERIVGTVSEIPEYEIWESGDGPIQVNSRIWIKVK